MALKALTILAAASFFLGFLVVNIYLAQFGFWDFNFLKVEYISAGILFFVFVTMGVLILLIWEKFINSIKKQVTGDDRVKRIGGGIARVASYPLLLVVNTILFLTPIEAPSLNRFFHVLAEAIIWTILIHVSVVAMRHAHKQIRSFKDAFSNLDETTTAWGKLFRLIYVPMLALFVFVTFTGYVYPLVPRAWGGGRPVPVVLTLNGDAQFTSPLNAELIYQSSDSALIQVGADTYLIKQSEIAHIQYLEKGAAFQIWFAPIIQN